MVTSKKLLTSTWDCPNYRDEQTELRRKSQKKPKMPFVVHLGWKFLLDKKKQLHGPWNISDRPKWRRGGSWANLSMKTPRPQVNWKKPGLGQIKTWNKFKIKERKREQEKKNSPGSAKPVKSPDGFVHEYILTPIIARFCTKLKICLVAVGLPEAQIDWGQWRYLKEPLSCKSSKCRFDQRPSIGGSISNDAWDRDFFPVIQEVQLDVAWCSKEMGKFRQSNTSSDRLAGWESLKINSTEMK